MEKLKNSVCIDTYKKEMIKRMQSINPKWNKKDISKIIDDMLKQQLKNPKVELDNNYTGEHTETTLLSVFDWALTREPKPIIAGNATFYKNQHEAFNPIANMLQRFLKNRKQIKGKMFQIEDTDSDEYKAEDRNQGNEKVNANSYYGGSGAKSSAFYSKWSGPATTLSAQSVISTTESTFEAVIGDNYLFVDSNEMCKWIEIVLSEKGDLDSFIKLKSVEEVYDRLINKLITKNDEDEEYLFAFLKNLSNEELTRLYYKNNLITFIDSHNEIKDLILEIFDKVPTIDEIRDGDNWRDSIPERYRIKFTDNTKKYSDWKHFYQKESFMNPNEIPEDIKNSLNRLKELFMKYVYVQYMPFDRVYRLKNFKRKVVTVIDTDSNILSLDTLMNYTFDKILDGLSFNREYIKNVFIGVNMYTYFITEAVTDILLDYGKHSNIPEEYRSKLNMKNEFFFSRLVIGLTKKRYISKILLREGNFMNPPKLDVKGFEFKKATCSEYAEEYFMSLIQKHIIESDNIELPEILNGLHKFEKEIKDSIMNQERRFLPNASAKEVGAYKDPSSEQSIRGVMTWNLLYPDNQIELPAKVNIIKMNIFTESSIDDLKEKDPEIYNKIITGIFNDETGIFVTKKYEVDYIDYISATSNWKKDTFWLNKIPKKYRTKFKNKGPKEWNKFVESGEYQQVDQKGHWEYKKRGLQVLAIPSNSQIPKWALDYIDLSTMIDNIIAPFGPVLDIFKSQFVQVGKTHAGVNRKTNKFTNIVKF